MTKQELKDIIIDVIKTNGTEGITGDLLQEKLLQMIDFDLTVQGLNSTTIPQEDLTGEEFIIFVKTGEEGSFKIQLETFIAVILSQIENTFSNIRFVTNSRDFVSEDENSLLVIGNDQEDVYLTFPEPQYDIDNNITNNVFVGGKISLFFLTQGGFSLQYGANVIQPLTKQTPGNDVNTQTQFISCFTYADTNGSGLAMTSTTGGVVLDPNDSTKSMTVERYLYDKSNGVFGLESKSYSEWNQLKQSGLLPKSQDIIVTDASGVNLGLKLTTNKEGLDFETKGVGSFLNADFSNIGNYINTYAYKSDLQFYGSGLNDITVSIYIGTKQSVSGTLTCIETNVQRIGINNIDLLPVNIGDIIVGNQNGSTGEVISRSFRYEHYGTGLEMYLKVTNGDFYTEGQGVTNQTTSISVPSISSTQINDYWNYNDGTINVSFLNNGINVDNGDYYIYIGSYTGHTKNDSWTITYTKIEQAGGNKGVWYGALDYFTIDYLVSPGNGDGNDFIIGETIYTDNGHQGIILSNTFDSGNGTGQLTAYALNGTTEQWGDMGQFFNQAETIAANYQGRSSRALGIGNIVIYNNLHYILGGQANGSSPDNDSAYILLDKSLSNGYVISNDIVEYDFTNDICFSRTSKESHIIGYTNGIDIFPWGQPNVLIKMEHPISSLDLRNYSGTGNLRGRIAGINHNISIRECQGDIYFDVTGVGQTIDCYNTFVLSERSIQIHLIGFNNGLSLRNSSGLDKVFYLYNNSSVYADNCSGKITARYYDASQVSHYQHQGDITWGRFEAGFNGIVSLDEGYDHHDCKYAIADSYITFPRNVSYTNKELTNGGSTFDTRINMEELADPNSGILNIPSWAGSIKLVCDTSKTISSIVTDTHFNRLFTNYGNGITFNQNSNLLNKNNSDRTIFINDTDYIEYKYFPNIDKWIERDFVTFD